MATLRMTQVRQEAKILSRAEETKVTSFQKGCLRMFRNPRPKNAGNAPTTSRMLGTFPSQRRECGKNNDGPKPNHCPLTKRWGWAWGKLRGGETGIKPRDHKREQDITQFQIIKI